ncbi:MAG: hypothetical protein VCD00_19325 [Candidatus Hydrogenedentota bacterium]
MTFSDASTSLVIGLLVAHIQPAALAAPSDSITYYRDVAPIFEAHCVTCHRANEVAPMSLMEYDQVRPWAKSIKEQVSKKIMPPFHADGPIGRYENDLRLTDDHISTVADWVDQGARRGKP